MSKLDIPYPVSDPDLIAISLAYKNTKLIADNVFPRRPVGKEEFKFYAYPKGQFLTIQRSKAGRKGELNKVDFEAQKQLGSVEHYGLQTDIPAADISNAAEGLNPVNIGTEGLRALVLLEREVRAAKLAFDPANYATENKVQLAGNNRWDVSHADSTPIEDIEKGLNLPMIRPNKMVIGQAAWSVLRMHPDIVKATNRNSGDTGIASKAAVAELFELDDIYVGQGWVNIAKPGQPVVRERVWGKHCLLFNDDATAMPTLGMGMTFGFTAQLGGPTAVANPVQAGKMGLDGGLTVVNGEKVGEYITANDLGYLLEDVIS